MLSLNGFKKIITSLLVAGGIVTFPTIEAPAMIWALGSPQGRVVAKVHRFCILALLGSNGLTLVGSFLSRDPLLPLFQMGNLGMILGDSSREELRFQRLSPSEGRSLGLVPRERLSYNSQLVRINLAFDELQHEGFRQVEENENGQALNETVARQAWIEAAHRAKLSSLTLTAVEKVVAGTLASQTH